MDYEVDSEGEWEEEPEDGEQLSVGFPPVTLCFPTQCHPLLAAFNSVSPMVS